MRVNREVLRARVAKQTRSALRLPRRLAHAAQVALRIVYWAVTFQLRRGLRQRRDARLIRNSDLFDPSFYLAQRAGDGDAADPVLDYIRVGASRGLAPSPLFDGSAYADRNPAVRATGENPLAHFIRSRKAILDAPAPAPPPNELDRSEPWRTPLVATQETRRSFLVICSRAPATDGVDGVLALLGALREIGFAVTVVAAEAAVVHLAAEGRAYGFVLLSGAEQAFRLLPAVRAHAIHATVIYERGALGWTREGEGAESARDAVAREDLARMEEVASSCADVVCVRAADHAARPHRDRPGVRLEIIPAGGELSAGTLERIFRPRAEVPTPSAVHAGEVEGERRVDELEQPAPPGESVAGGSGRRASRGSVLVIGVYLCDVKNNAVEIARELARSEDWRVEQRWIAVGKSSLPEPLEPLTAWTQRSRAPKFVLLNRLLASLNVEGHEFVLVCDDDISLPAGFVDAYLDLVVRHDLALAQPARTHGSYTDNWIVERLDGLAARTTRFVEIGPLFSLRRDAARLLTPFDETSPMGWGYDFSWPVVIEEAGLRMGIVDATPVAHDMRKPVALYDNRDAAIAMQAFLSRRAHLSPHEAFSILEAYA